MKILKKLVPAAVAYAVLIALSMLGRAYAHPEDLVNSFADSKEGPRIVSPHTESSTLFSIIDAKVPFIGSPVHEKMTVASINLSQVHKRSFRLNYDDAYIHGAFWNDDPLEMLCPSCSAWNLLKFDKRWGIQFGLRFNAAKKRAQGDKNTPPYFFSGSDGLLERSHFGDLQFWHGMATRDGEKAKETQARILDWAEFTYTVATGALDQRTKISEIRDIPISISAVRDLLSADPNLKNKSIEELFRGREMARQVAIGSLLHMIQDSYAPGHADRVVMDYKDKSGKIVFSRGAIKSFHSYINQDGDKHAADDKWPDGLEAPVLVANDNPISVGAQLLVLVYQNNGSGAPWPEVKKYLEDVVFKITDPEAVSGPGDKYGRRKP